MELSLLYAKSRGRRNLNELFLFQTTCLDYAKGKEIYFFFFLWSVTFQLLKDNAGTLQLSISMSVPSRGKLYKEVLGTASHQLILHLKKHLDCFGTVWHLGLFVWLHKHNAGSFKEAIFLLPFLALLLSQITLFVHKCMSKF